MDGCPSHKNFLFCYWFYMTCTHVMGRTVRPKKGTQCCFEEYPNNDYEDYYGNAMTSKFLSQSDRPVSAFSQINCTVKRNFLVFKFRQKQLRAKKLWFSNKDNQRNIWPALTCNYLIKNVFFCDFKIVYFMNEILKGTKSWKIFAAIFISPQTPQP